MGLNLHGIVRGAINTVNPDQTGVWRESSGSTTDAAGMTTPTYTNHANVGMQVQAASWKDLQHKDWLSMQGVKRSVYLFGTVEGINKPQAKGGDILQFPKETGGQVFNWLVTVVFEEWAPAGTWSKVGVVMQGPVAL
jgi:hypothetical protein